MSRTRSIILSMMLALMASTAHRAGATETSRSTNATAPADSTPASRRSNARPDSPRSNRPNAAPRMLEDIHIEGEVPVPQVLFVTAQDQRRFLESHHRRYLRTSLAIGRATSMPERIRLTRAGARPSREAQ